MGITGLLPYMAEATRDCHLSEFSGGVIAVDSYCILHRGAISCAEQLARGEDTKIYLNYCMRYVKMLLSHGVHPIMVFDGRHLPAKSETETKRRKARKKARQRAAELLNLGKNNEARSFLKQCVDITPKMAHSFIVECRKLKVDCIIAPYESDAQLAFFNIKGVAECVITEDSDLVLFGSKKVLYKLDFTGAGRLVEADKLCLAMKMRPDQFTIDKFRFMCILSGCDYVRNLSGIGLKNAEKFMKLTAETNPEIFLDRIPRYLNMNHLNITDDYKRKVLIANATFLHQVVFDPYKKKLVYLNDPDVTGTNPEYLVNVGEISREISDDEQAFQVAIGNMNPFNFEQCDDWDPLQSDLPEYSIWSGLDKKRISNKEQKKMQKSKLKEFLSQEQKKIETCKINKELESIEEDHQIDKDLAKYTSPQVVIPEEVEVKEEPVPENKVSPVLPKNPFLKKKRISKFPKTLVDGSSVVKSRFFCSETSVKPSSQREETVVIGETSTLEKAEEITATTSVLQSCENTKEPPRKKKRSLECTYKSEPEQALEETKYEEDVVVITTDINKEKVNNKPKKKQRKVGSCKKVGLGKPKNSSQKTLHNFFSTLKPE